MTAAGAGRRGAPAGAVPSCHLLHADDLVRVTRTRGSGPSVVRLAGEIDASNAAEVGRALARARQIDELIVLDVAGLAFVDVAGVRALARFCREGWTRLDNVPPRMTRLLRVLNWPLV
ncbi:STAS domain-containing protein [Nonomuraea pusilla]|uniref:STAS domain-containing protein n=1 Tax=Nonomuraea pusilla TaxID=46177 RepID=UPI00332E2504